MCQAIFKAVWKAVTGGRTYLLTKNVDFAFHFQVKLKIYNQQ